MKNFIALDSEKVFDLYMMLADARHCLEDYLTIEQQNGFKSCMSKAYTRRIKLAKDLEAFLQTAEAVLIEEAK